MVISIINYIFGNILWFIIDIGGVGGGMSWFDFGVSGLFIMGVEIGDFFRFWFFEEYDELVEVFMWLEYFELLFLLMVLFLWFFDREDECFNDGFNLCLIVVNNLKGERDEGVLGDIVEIFVFVNVLFMVDVFMFEDFLNSFCFFFGCLVFRCELFFLWNFDLLLFEEYLCFLLIFVDLLIVFLVRLFEISVVLFLIVILFLLIDLILDGCWLLFFKFLKNIFWVVFFEILELFDGML